MTTEEGRSLVLLKRKGMVTVWISDHPTTVESLNHKMQHDKLLHSNQMPKFIVCGPQRYSTKAQDLLILFVRTTRCATRIALALSGRFQSSRNATSLSVLRILFQENYLIKLLTASNFGINPNSMLILESVPITL